MNRPYFEKLAKDVLNRPDLISLGQYYSRSPASGLWVLERGDVFIGLIALDASLEAESVEPVSSETTSKYKKGTSSTAVIRHFYVDEEFRPAGVQEDLLNEALNHAFTNPKIQDVKTYNSTLVGYTQKCFRDAGFKLQRNTGKVGVLGWNIGEHTLDRETWQEKQKKLQ